jgi:hypothetical protein
MNGAAHSSIAWPALRWTRWSDELWSIQPTSLEADATNRGHIGHLLLARHAGRIWLVGAGPSPAWARAFDEQVLQRWGQRVTDVALPMAQPEFVLGASGYTQARVWTTQDLDATLRHRCTDCVAQWRLRLGEASADLGDSPVRWADTTASEAQGQWGPFTWQAWQLMRRDGTDLPGLLWWHPAARVGGAWGLLWGEAPPDLRDADVASLLAAREGWVEQVSAWNPSGDGVWLGSQGQPMAAGIWQADSAVFAYWAHLHESAREGVENGQLLAASPPKSNGRWPAPWAEHPRHALNWQRIWRQAEEALFAPQPN